MLRSDSKKFLKSICGEITTFEKEDISATIKRLEDDMADDDASNLVPSTNKVHICFDVLSELVCPEMAKS